MVEGSRVRDALLEAAYSAVAAGEWGRIRMADVAASAGVSRQTLYNEFGSKDGLAAALVWRRIEIFLNGIDTLLGSTLAASGGVDRPLDRRGWIEDDVARMVSDSVRWVLATAQADPLVRSLLTASQEAELLPFLSTRAGFLLTAARDRVAAFTTANWPALPAEDVRLTAEVVVRLLVSHLMIATESVDVTVQTLTALVLRVLRLDGAPAW